MRVFVLFSFIFLTGSSSANAQALQKYGDYYELSVVSPYPDKAHDIAVVFADLVGQTLKSSYPSKLLDPSVTLRVFTRVGQKFYRLTYGCRIVTATVEDADYIFFRQGTLLSGKTLAEAKREVEAELKKSGKVEKMRKAFVGSNIPENFIRDSFSGSNSEGFWYIKEIFLVAPKPKK